jgi:hypothetical protein
MDVEREYEIVIAPYLRCRDYERGSAALVYRLRRCACIDTLYVVRRVTLTVEDHKAS